MMSIVTTRKDVGPTIIRVAASKRSHHLLMHTKMFTLYIGEKERHGGGLNRQNNEFPQNLYILNRICNFY